MASHRYRCQYGRGEITEHPSARRTRCPRCGAVLTSRLCVRLDPDEPTPVRTRSKRLPKTSAEVADHVFAKPIRHAQAERTAPGLHAKDAWSRAVVFLRMLAGEKVWNDGYERQTDNCFEMDDGDAVINYLLGFAETEPRLRSLLENHRNVGLTILDHWRKIRLSRTHEAFQKAIRDLAERGGKTALEVHTLWQKYSRECFDQSALLPEFESWYAGELGLTAPAPNSTEPLLPLPPTTNVIAFPMNPVERARAFFRNL